MENIRVITISEGAAGMKSQIHGLANLINPNFRDFDIKIKSLFEFAWNLPKNHKQAEQIVWVFGNFAVKHGIPGIVRSYTS